MAGPRTLFSVGAVCMLLAPLWVTAAAAQTFLTSWGTFGTEPGQFRTPQGVAVGGRGDIYVVDGDNGRVQVFTSGGTFIRMWPSSGPNIAVDANDNVYVGDYERMIRMYTR